ncbi:MAG: hypothetical protein ACU84Q_14435 [Gammaproteobacteria bacterium]
MTVIILSPNGAREWSGHAKIVYVRRFAATIDKALEDASNDSITIIDLPFYDPEKWHCEAPPEQAMERTC